MIKLKRNSTLFTLDSVRSVSKKDVNWGGHKYQAIIKITYADEKDIILGYGTDDRYVGDHHCEKARNADFEELEGMLLISEPESEE